MAFHLDRKAAVLRQTRFRNVHVAHDLDTGHNGRGKFQGNFGRFAEHPFHTIADVHRRLFGIDVNVAGAHFDAFGQDEVYETNDRDVVNGIVRDDFFVLQTGIGRRVRVDFAQHFGEGAVFAVDRAEKPYEVRLRAEHGFHLTAAGFFDGVQSPEVVGIKKRAVQHALFKGEGHEAVFACHVLRHQVLQMGVERKFVRVVKGEVQLLGQGLQNVFFRDDAVARQVFPQLHVGGFRGRQGVFQSFFSENAL